MNGGHRGAAAIKSRAILAALMLLVSAAPISAAQATSESAPQESLLVLTTNRFGKLSIAEERLVNATTNGQTASCRDLSGDDKKIRGQLFSWLCSDPRGTANVTYRGVSVYGGAEIVDDVDLRWARISFPISIVECVVRGTIDLENSRTSSLNLESSTVTHLAADAAQIEGGVFLSNGFKAENGANFEGARIDGNFVCDGGEFIGNDGMLAINGYRLEVRGDILFRFAFHAQGGVDLSRAKVDGDFVCDDGTFVGNGKSPALIADTAQIDGSVLFRKGFVAQGGVELSGAYINGSFSCDDGRVIGTNDRPALAAYGIQVKQNVFLRSGFDAVGEVSLIHARIEGDLDCSGGKFVAENRTALNANGAEIKGNVYLSSGFTAKGGVNLVAAQISRQIACDGGEFEGTSEIPAINANDAEINGNLYLRYGFKADGEVDLVSAKIGGSLWCDKGQFVSKGETPAFNAESARIEGSVYFRRGLRATGEVVFYAAQIGGSFQWFDVESPEKTIVDLRQCKIGTLLNRRDSWPAKGNLLIDGCVYDKIDEAAPPSARIQLSYLSRQPSDRFRPQPFEQLADVLRKMGLDEDARSVMIAENEEYARYVQLRPEWLWYGLFGHLIAYGYSPWRVVPISIILVGIGWLIFGSGYRLGLVTPTPRTEDVLEQDRAYPVSANYPKFNAFVYSLETFVPFVKLGISDYWMPNANRGRSLRLGIVNLKTGSLLREYLWFHIIAGWVMTILWIACLAGLIKR